MAFATAVQLGDDPPAALNRMVNDGSLFAYFGIAPDPVASDEGCKYISLNLTDQDLRRWFADQVFQVVRARRIEQAGLDAETSNWLQTPGHFAERKVDKRGDEAEVSTADRVQQWAVVPFVYLLWMAVFINAQTLMTNTVLLLLSIYFAVRGAGKVFIGILMTGKPPRVGEVMRWLTAKEDLSPAEREADQVS